MTIGTSLSRRMHAAQVEAVAAGQHDVQQDEVDGVGLQHPGHLGSVAGAERLEAFLAQQPHQEGAQGRIVLDDQDGRRQWRGRHLARQGDRSVARRIHMPGYLGAAIARTRSEPTISVRLEPKARALSRPRRGGPSRAFCR
jgi:hypothetical protein